MIYLSLLLCLCLSVPGFAAESKVVSSMIGVGTHVTSYAPGINVAQMLKVLGVKFVRDEFNWHKAEKVKGKFILDPRIFEYIDKLNGLNIRALMILCYSNPNYTKNNIVGPNNAELRKAFSDYVAFMVTSLKGKVYAWEIWNEPDWGTWKPAPNSRDYALLVKHVAPIIRKIDPQALIVAGALAGADRKFLKGLQEENALADVDVISFHWYTYPAPPEQGWGDHEVNLIRSFIKEIKSLGKRAWISEMGYPTSTDKYGVSEAQQAEYLKKQLELAANMGAEVCFIYNLIDNGTDAGNKEHRFGLFRGDGAPKPAVAALAGVNQVPAK